jgi:hypothetical protein
MASILPNWIGDDEIIFYFWFAFLSRNTPAALPNLASPANFTGQPSSALPRGVGLPCLAYPRGKGEDGHSQTLGGRYIKLTR